jgi:hypothetical protein
VKDATIGIRTFEDYSIWLNDRQHVFGIIFGDNCARLVPFILIHPLYLKKLL